MNGSPSGPAMELVTSRIIFSHASTHRVVLKHAPTANVSIQQNAIMMFYRSTARMRLKDRKESKAFFDKNPPDSMICWLCQLGHTCASFK